MSNEETIKWIKVKFREPTEEEKEYYEDTYGTDLCYMFDCQMPEGGEEILIHGKYGVDNDVAMYDDGWSLESDRDWADVIAWAEMPKGIDWSEEK